MVTLWTGGLRGTMLGMAVALTLGGCDSPEERAEKHYLRGVELLAADETAKAQIEFRNALRLNEDHVEARLATARMNEQQGNLRAAFGQYARVAELDPANLSARLKLAQFNLAAGALDESRRYADEAVALGPDDPEALAVRAGVLYRLGDESGALAEAEKALQIDPDNISATVLLVADGMRNGAEAEAMARLDALLERKPSDETLNAVKLRFLAQQNDMAAVESHLAGLVERFPEATSYRRSLASLYVSQRRLELAETQLREIVARAPDDTDMAIMLVNLVGANRGEAAARAELESMIAARNDPPLRQPLQFALADLLYRAGNKDEARALLESAMTEPKRDMMVDRVRVRLARLELAEDRRDAARTLIDQVLERDSDNVDALELRARIEIDEERPEEAILTLRRALGVEPQNVQLLLLEALAHERNGNPTLVGERLSSALRASDFAPKVALSYARFLRGRDQAASAETVLEESARRNPDNRDILAALAELRIQLGDLVGAEAIAGQLRNMENGSAVADRIAVASLMGRGETEQSVSLLERIVEEETEDPGQGALAALVASYVRNGEQARAVTLLDGLIAENPANIRARVLRAELHLLAGDATAAEQQLKDGTAQAPDNPLGYTVLARFYLQQNRAAEAEAVAREGMAAVPGDGNLPLLLASLLEQRGVFEEAIAVYSELYERNPNSLIVANNYASLLAEFRETDPDTVARAARIARRLRSSAVPQFMDTYAWTAFLSGNVEEARRVLAEVAAQLPNNPLVRYHYGRVLAAAGAADEARRELEAALAIDAAFPKAESARQTLASLTPKEG